MRIKVLLGAALVAASALTATAQNVYSLNVVGYVNLPLVDGFNMVANPLDLDGNGTNNTTTTVFGQSLPTGSRVYAWNGAGYDIATYAVKGGVGSWSPNVAINPGRGFWLSIPNGTFGAGVTGSVTTVGNVLQNSLVNKNLAAAGGFAILGSMAPVQGKLVTDLKLSPSNADRVYLWNGNGWDIYTYAVKGGVGSWGTTGEPVINVGQGFWLSSSASSTWSNYFVVPQQ